MWTLNIYEMHTLHSGDDTRRLCSFENRFWIFKWAQVKDRTPCRLQTLQCIPHLWHIDAEIQKAENLKMNKNESNSISLSGNFNELLLITSQWLHVHMLMDRFCPSSYINMWQCDMNVLNTDANGRTFDSPFTSNYIQHSFFACNPPGGMLFLSNAAYAVLIHRFPHIGYFSPPHTCVIN